MLTALFPIENPIESGGSNPGYGVDEKPIVWASTAAMDPPEGYTAQNFVNIFNAGKAY